MAAPLHLGLLDLSDPRWGAGGAFSRMLLHSLQATLPPQGRLSVLGGTGDPGLAVPRIPVPSLRAWPGETWLRRTLGQPVKGSVFHAAEKAGVEVVLPLIGLREKPRCRTIGWIPDFQHVYLPEFFTEKDLQLRAYGYRLLVENSDRILLSSRDAQKDFLATYPDFAAKAFVAQFPSLFAFEPPEESPDVTRKYHLPAKFALLTNQFWRHKNHAVVIAAIGLLARQGLEIPLVLTGLPLDSRDATNATTSQILQQIAQAGLSAQCRVLGMVPREDLTALLRRAAVVLQPSRFEGWNTTIQDAKALGRPLLCSRLPVHEEQAPQALGYFACDAPEELAELLRRHWPELPAGPDRGAEDAALAAERALARRHGEILQEACGA